MELYDENGEPLRTDDYFAFNPAGAMQLAYDRFVLGLAGDSSEGHLPLVGHAGEVLGHLPGHRGQVAEEPGVDRLRIQLVEQRL